jgi:hypothetical protein
MNANMEQSDEQYMRRYLRDVYGTEDLEALHGSMPDARWEVFLNPDAGKCAWLLGMVLTI